MPPLSKQALIKRYRYWKTSASFIILSSKLCWEHQTENLGAPKRLLTHKNHLKPKNLTCRFCPSELGSTHIMETLSIFLNFEFRITLRASNRRCWSQETHPNTLQSLKTKKYHVAFTRVRKYWANSNPKHIGTEKCLHFLNSVLRITLRAWRRRCWSHKTPPIS